MSFVDLPEDLYFKILMAGRHPPYTDHKSILFIKEIISFSHLCKKTYNFVNQNNFFISIKPYLSKSFELNFISKQSCDWKSILISKTHHWHKPYSKIEFTDYALFKTIQHAFYSELEQRIVLYGFHPFGKSIYRITEKEISRISTIDRPASDISGFACSETWLACQKGAEIVLINQQSKKEITILAKGIPAQMEWNGGFLYVLIKNSAGSYEIYLYDANEISTPPQVMALPHPQIPVDDYAYNFYILNDGFLFWSHNDKFWEFRLIHSFEENDFKTAPCYSIKFSLSLAKHFEFTFSDDVLYFVSLMQDNIVLSKVPLLQGCEFTDLVCINLENSDAKLKIQSVKFHMDKIFILLSNQELLIYNIKLNDYQRVSFKQWNLFSHECDPQIIATSFKVYCVFQCFSLVNGVVFRAFNLQA